MADTYPTQQWQNPLSGLISSILGGETDQDLKKTETGTKTGTQNQQIVTNQNVMGSTNQSTTGSTNQATSGTTTQNTSGTSTQKSQADISALQQVFAKQSAGVTPEMLTALFSEGAKKVPSLATTYGSAVGARASDNTPLATSIRGLQADLTNQAAVLNNQLLSDSSATAARIAELTKQMSTETTQQQVGGNNQTTSGVTGQNTVGTTNQNTTGTNNTNLQTNEQNTMNTNQSIDETRTVDKDMLKLLAGLGIGTSALDTVLGGNGVKGGLNDLAGIITGVGSGGKAIGNLWDSLFGAGSYAKDLAAAGVGNTDAALALGSGLEGLLGNDTTDWASGLGDYLSSFGWADGGAITADKSTAKENPAARQEMLRKVMVLKQLQSDPKGRLMLKERMMRGAENDPQKQNEVQTWYAGLDPKAQQDLGGNFITQFKALDRERQNFEKEWMKTPEGKDYNNIMMQNQGAIIEGEKTSSYVELPAKNGRMAWEESLPQDVKNMFRSLEGQYSAMKDNTAWGKTTNVLGAVAKMIPMSVAGLGIGGAVGALGQGLSNAAGFGAAGSSGGAGAKIAATGIKQLTNAGTQRLRKADGGAITGDPNEDPDGNKDTVDGTLSIGEFVQPTDVVEAVGIDFMQHMIDRWHTPVEMQQAMGVSQ